MFDAQNKQEIKYSTAVLADILSQSKATINSRIKRGELTPCSNTGLIPLKQVEEYPEIQTMLYSKWDDEHAVKPSRKYNLVELFSGGGGLAIGMEQAGLEIVLLNEINKHACNTLRHNRPDWNVVEGDISQVDFTQIKEDVDILTGGFPCQAFSYAGKSLDFEDTRGILFFEMAKAIKEIQPKIFMAESIKGLFLHDKGRTLETIKSVIDELGYELVEPRVLKAIFYKVPQKREHLILVGIRKDLAQDVKFHWPSPYKRVMTLRDALYAGDLYNTDVEESPGIEYPERTKEIMAEVPQGGYWRVLSEKRQREYMQKSELLEGGATGMARRLSLSEPSLTLTTSPAQKQTERCHPIHTRPLQVREYARIQTFPDNWEFQGSKNAAYKQIGNAVPVNMARALGHSLVKLLNNIEHIEYTNRMNNDLSKLIEEKLEENIDTYLKQWNKKPQQPLDIIFPKERRIRSIIGGLETSLGTKLWEKVAKYCAEKDGFTVHNEKKLKRPKIRPEAIEDVVTKWRNRRETKGAIVSLQPYIDELRKVASSNNYQFNTDDLTTFRSGQGADLHLEKNDIHYIYDIKTVQINQGDGLKFNNTIINWYADLICLYPNIKIRCALAFPYNPYKPKTWWQGNGARAFPLIAQEDAFVEEEFWDFLSGEKQTWETINDAFSALGRKNLSEKYSHIFYE